MELWKRKYGTSEMNTETSQINNAGGDTITRSGAGKAPNEATEVIEIGDIVQIKPEAHPMFAGCLLVVTELRSFGVQGYIRPPGENVGLVFCRPHYDKIVRVGRVAYIRNFGGDDTSDETEGQES